MECQRKGLADNTFKNAKKKKKERKKTTLWQECTGEVFWTETGKKKPLLTYAHTHSDKGIKVINAHPHEVSHVLHENVNKDDYLACSATSTLTQAVNVAPTINMLNSIKAWYYFNKRKSLRLK